MELSRNPAEALRPVRELVQKASAAFLGTIDDEGRPFVTCVAFVDEAVDAAKGSRTTAPRPEEERLSVWLYLSDLSRHTRNLRRRPETSLLVVDVSKVAYPNEASRATLLGLARAMPPASERLGSIQKRYLEKYPQARRYFSFPDFSFFFVEVNEIHWFGGFGNTATFVFGGGNWSIAGGCG